MNTWYRVKVAWYILAGLMLLAGLIYFQLTHPNPWAILIGIPFGWVLGTWTVQGIQRTWDQADEDLRLRQRWAALRQESQDLRRIMRAL